MGTYFSSRYVVLEPVPIDALQPIDIGFGLTLVLDTSKKNHNICFWRVLWTCPPQPYDLEIVQTFKSGLKLRSRYTDCVGLNKCRIFPALCNKVAFKFHSC